MANKRTQSEKSRSKLVKIPARRGVAVHVCKGQKVKIMLFVKEPVMFVL